MSVALTVIVDPGDLEGPRSCEFFRMIVHKMLGIFVSLFMFPIAVRPFDDNVSLGCLKRR